jgi:hypothetical protein
MQNLYLAFGLITEVYESLETGIKNTVQRQITSIPKHFE